MRMCPGFWGISVAVVAAIVLATAGTTVAQQTPESGNTLPGDDILTTLSRALPAVIAWALAFILLMRFLGLLHMGLPSVILVGVTIAALLWRYHWLPVH